MEHQDHTNESTEMAIINGAIRDIYAEMTYLITQSEKHKSDIANAEQNIIRCQIKLKNCKSDKDAFTLTLKQIESEKKNYQYFLGNFENYVATGEFERPMRTTFERELFDADERIKLTRSFIRRASKMEPFYDLQLQTSTNLSKNLSKYLSIINKHIPVLEEYLASYKKQKEHILGSLKNNGKKYNIEKDLDTSRLSQLLCSSLIEFNKNVSRHACGGVIPMPYTTISQLHHEFLIPSSPVGNNCGIHAMMDALGYVFEEQHKEEIRQQRGYPTGQMLNTDQLSEILRRTFRDISTTMFVLELRSVNTEEGLHTEYTLSVDLPYEDKGDGRVIFLVNKQVHYESIDLQNPYMTWYGPNIQDKLKSVFTFLCGMTEQEFNDMPEKSYGWTEVVEQLHKQLY